MNLYRIDTDNLEDYEDHCRRTFLVLADTEVEARNIMREDKERWGANWPIDSIEEYEDVNWKNRPSIAGIISGD